ncbi:unnamed protein product [Anisakis simplex]|uniref:C2H2-type domain-containing protein n=1 Tax=Anisakis simplex TaxID=6269 RepID=A0A0M3KDB3_ANISI|nr:unnamed protein product [Anisakis simplex]
MEAIGIVDFRMLMRAGKISAPRFAAESRQNEWTLNSNGVYIGPIAGLQYLLYFGTLPYCDLCYMVLDEQNVMEHFSSENHLIKFLSYNRPASMYTAMYLPEDARRSHMLSLLGCLGTDCSVGGSPRKVEVAHIPELVIANSNPIMANVPSLMPPCMSIGVENFCFWCPVPKEDDERIQLWTEHCTKSRKHFECAVRRDLFNFEDVNFVDIVTTLQLPAFKQLASWELVKMNNGMEIKIQHFTYIGLDFVVDDVLNNEIVCIACAEIFSRSDLSQLCLHIRSRNHLLQYLHTTDREMYNLIESQQMQHAVDNLLIDYLRRSISSVGQIRVYNANLAVTAKSWGQLPYRKVQLANVDAEHRAAFELLVKIVDQLANDKAEQITIPIKDALQLCSIRIQTVADKNVLLYCKGCERILSVAGNAVEKGVWDEHLLGELHAKRADSLAKNKFGL